MFNFVKNPFRSVNSSVISLQNLPLSSKTLLTINFKVTLPLVMSQLQVDPPLSSWSWETEMLKPQKSASETSETAPRHTARPWDFVWGSPEQDFHIALLRTIKAKSKHCLGSGHVLSSQGFPKAMWVWGMGKGKKPQASLKLMANYWHLIAMGPARFARHGGIPNLRTEGWILHVAPCMP